MNEWKTIDSAPLDGTTVLVADCFGVLAAAFDAPPSRAEYEDIIGEKITDKEWKQELTNYSCSWRTVDPISGDTGLLHPTHWMPMPSAPAEALAPEPRGASR